MDDPWIHCGWGQTGKGDCSRCSSELSRDLGLDLDEQKWKGMSGIVSQPVSLARVTCAFPGSLVSTFNYIDGWLFRRSFDAYKN